jgi:hypothetical protein
MRSFLQAFRRNADGSWECIEHTSFAGPHGRMEVTRGSVFTPGTPFMGVDLAAWLDEQANGRT